jgi:hypothetical protein
MRLRSVGQPLDLQREALRAAFPQASPKVLPFVASMAASASTAPRSRSSEGSAAPA